MYLSVFVFFFFKQKTAYEMRISDWSSDVCSSDLRRYDAAARGWREPSRHRRRRRGRGRGSGRSGQRLRDRRHGFPCRCKILSDRDGPFENEKRPRRDQTEADEMVHGQLLTEPEDREPGEYDQGDDFLQGLAFGGAVDAIADRREERREGIEGASTG